MVCKFPDGYSAEETLELVRLAWNLGSPAVAAHCGSQIMQRAAGSIGSLAGIDVQSWRLAAQRLEYRAAIHHGVGAALDSDLVPVACLTDKDVQVLLRAEELLAKRIHSEQMYASVIDQMESAASIRKARQKAEARIVPETLERNNQPQICHGTTLADAATSMPRLGPQRTPASSGNQISSSPSNKPSTMTSSNQDACAVCMSALVQAGFLQG